MTDRTWSSKTLPLTPSPPLFFLLLAFILSTQSAFSLGSKLSSESLLKKQLFENYDNDIRPVLNSSDIIELRLTFYLDYIVHIDEKHEIFSLKGSVFLQWRDEMLTWEPSKYNNIEHLVLKSSFVWTPSLIVTNSVDSEKLLSQPLRIHSNGVIYLKTAQVYTTHCRIKVSHFPFDTQICKISFSTMADIVDRVCIKVNADNAYNMSHFSIHDGWHLLKVEGVLKNIIVSGKNCSNKMHFYFTIQRNYLYYMLVVISPLLLMYFCTTLVFFIPVDTGEKISFSNVLILSFAVFMNSFSNILPHSSGQVSILAVFVILYVIQCILTFILSCCITRIRHCQRNPFTLPCGLGSFLQRLYFSSVNKNSQTTLISFINMTRSLFLPPLRNTWKPSSPELTTKAANESYSGTKQKYTLAVEIRRHLCDILDYYFFYFSCLLVFVEILVTFCFFTAMTETF